MPGGMADAVVEVADEANILELPAKGDAPAADLAHHRFRIAGPRAVVDYLDLHLGRAGILAQHALQRLAQVVGRAIVDWHHH